MDWAFDDIAAHELAPFEAGITKEMIEQSWNSVRVQCAPNGCCMGAGAVGLHVRGREIFQDLRNQSDRRFNNRVTYLIDLQLKPLIQAGGLASVDVVLDANDLPSGTVVSQRCDHQVVKFPLPPIVLSANKCSADKNVIPFMDHFYGKDFAQTRRGIKDAAHKLHWTNKTQRLFFNGQGAGYRNCLDHKTISEERDTLAVHFRGGCSAAEGDWCKPGRMWSKPEVCGYKYLLHLPGSSGSYSQRLKQLCLCSSAVIITQQPYYEFWYPLLEPYVHFIPAGNIQTTRGHELPGIVWCLRQYDDDAKLLADNMRRLADQYLTNDAHIHYAQKVFSRLNSLRKYGLDDIDWSRETRWQPK